MKGQHVRAMRDYCRAQHIQPGSLLPALLRVRLNARLARLEAEEVSVCTSVSRTPPKNGRDS